MVRGGITIGAGIAIGNALGFFRVAVTAYLLGTRSRADELAVAVSPIDALNAMLINTMVFAFVPMLILRAGKERENLFRAASRIFACIFGSITLLIIVLAPLLVRVLGPGLRGDQVQIAANILRIASLSTLAAGSTAIYTALLYTERKFWPTALNQACLNVFTLVGALSLWKVAGIYGFAIGYTLGSFVQLVSVYCAARTIPGGRLTRLGVSGKAPWKEYLAKPGAFLVYAGLISLNVMVTRAHATQTGPGMAAAFDYSIRCINVVIAYLVSPVSSSLVPEIARMRALNRSRQAVQLVDRTVLLAGGAAVAACLAGLALRTPVIALLFQRGSFTAESTAMVSAVFFGFAPSLIGWTLLEILSRSLFALDRPWLPLAAATVPVSVNALVSAFLAKTGRNGPEYLGLGASCGMIVAFGILFAAVHVLRKGWDAAPETNPNVTELVGAG